MATPVTQKFFGTGKVVYVPDITATNPAPVPVLTLQEVSLEIKGSSAKLVGENRAPVAVALSELDISGKFKSGVIHSGIVAAALPGATLTNGSMPRMIFQESTGTISGATYTTSKTTSVVVLGCWDENGAIMKPVSATPSAGQYSVTSGGVFTFNTGANTKTYTVDYCYTDAAATTGWTVSYSNQAMGPAATFKMYFHGYSLGKELNAILYSVTIPGLSLALKNTEWTLPEGTYEAYADSSGKLIDIAGEF